MKLSSFFKYAAELMVAIFLLNACSEKPDTEISAELLRKLKDPDPKIRSLAASRLGNPAHLKLVIRSLETYGNTEMTEDFLNCGNDELVNAARSWASRNGYFVIQRESYEGHPQWGKKRSF